MTRNKPRSNRYQWQFHELVFDPWSEHGYLFNSADPLHCARNEQLIAELIRAWWRIVDCHLTERQRYVLRCTAAGMKQTEIAKRLDVNQSSITKSINGNVQYSGRFAGLKYGGAARKVQSIAADDPEIQSIVRQLNTEIE